MAVQNVVCTHFEYHGTGRLAACRRRRRVQAFDTVTYWSGEIYDNILPLPPIPLKVSVKMRRTPSHRIY